MFETIRNAWKIADLKKKLLYTAFIIVIYRIGTAIPIPYMNSDTLSLYMTATQGSIFQYLNILTGNAFANATLFALGINPYITASIVMQLLCIAIPYLENLQKEGEEGRKKIDQITRYVTVVLGFITAFGYYQLLKSNDILTDTGVFAAVVIILSYCAGSALVMWLGEKINENGIGNGISMILFANIISRLPSDISKLISYVTGQGQYYNRADELVKVPVWLGIVLALITVVFLGAMIVFIVWMTNSERKIPIQYAKKVVGRKMYGGQSSTLPIKVNMTGVMPIIFANSIVTIPSTIAMFTNPTDGSFWDRFFGLFESSSVLYAVLTFVLIIAFAYFYISISFNPVEVSNNLKANGGSIPGIRPGRPTSDYITKILSRVTFIGALCLGVIAVVPLILNIVSGGAMTSLAFSGSSIIIVVGVVLETFREIEAQMTMRHYRGFLEN